MSTGTVVARPLDWAASLGDDEGIGDGRPSWDRLFERPTQHDVSRQPRDCLRGGIPELDDPGVVDEQHSVGDRADHAGRLTALVRLAEEPVALLGQAEALQRVLDVRGYRLEERCLGIVEALLVEPAHADDAAREPYAERRADERPRRDGEQVGALVALRRLTGEVEEPLVEQALRLARAQPVSPHDPRPSVRTGEHEGDLRLEYLAELRSHEAAELGLGLGLVHDRDDLRAPRGLDEAPQELVAAVSPFR